MSLGNNRDYKTRDRIARKGLAWHYARMCELMSQGMDRLSASAQAFQELKDKAASKKETRK